MKGVQMISFPIAILALSIAGYKISALAIDTQAIIFVLCALSNTNILIKLFNSR